MAADDAAVVVTLRANLKDYEAALKQAVRATEKAAASAEKAVSGIGRKGGAQPGQAVAASFQKSAGAIANDARQLQFQLNDIFSGIASGQGIRAVQQQLGQIAQQLSGGSLVAGAQTFGAAIAGMINPINLAVVAFGVLSTVAASYFSESEQGAAGTAEALAKSTAALDKEADAWEKLAKAANNAQISKIADDKRAAANAAEGMAAAVEAVNKQFDGLAENMTEQHNMFAAMIADLQQSGEGTSALQSAYQILQDHLEKHTVTLEDISRLQDALNAIQNQGIGTVKEYETAWQSLSNTLVQALQRIEDIIAAQRQQIELQKVYSAANVSTLQAGPGAFEGGGGPAAMAVRTDQDLLRARSDSVKIQERVNQLNAAYAQRLAKLLREFPEARISSAFRTYDEQKRIYDSGVRPAAKPGRSLHERGLAVDVSGLSAARLAELNRRAPEFGLKTLAGIGDPGHIQDASEAMDGLAESTTKAATGYNDLVASINEKIAAQQRENEITADYTLSSDEKTAALQREKAAQEAAKVEQQLNQAAVAQGIPLTDQLKASNHALAESYAAAGLQADQLATAQKQAAKTAQESAQLTQQINQQMAGIIGGGLSGFVQDLINGEDAGDAFNNMLKRMIGQLADMVIQMLIIKPLMESLGGGMSGGGIMGALGFGVAHQGGVVGRTQFPMRLADPRIFANAPRYATGGTVGLRAGEVPIIAHRGERIIPKGAGIGGDVHNNIGDINIDMSGTGLVATSTQSGKLLGRELQAAVQVVLVKESRPGGILRRPT